MFKPKFRILEMMNGKFIMQAKGLKTIFTWDSWIPRETLQLAKEDIEFFKKRIIEKKSSKIIKRIIEV